MSHHRRVYLDNNSTTPILPEVVESMRECHLSGVGNPASAHFAGREARQLLEHSRDRILEILNGQASLQADRLVFTSGGTEANNLALRGFTSGRQGRVIISKVEHPSVLGTADYLARAGYDVQRVGVTSHGVVDLEHLNGLLNESTVLVSLMMANNETGVIQPLREVAKLCAKKQIALHTDGVQAVGKIRVDFRNLGASALSFSAHKFHGPPGIGGLLVRHGMAVRPILFGGFQQDGIRPGTENVPIVVGMCRALEIWDANRTKLERQLTGLRDAFESRLQNSDDPLAIVNGSGTTRLPHTSSISFPGIDRQVLLLALDRAGIACSAGSACASGSSEPSHVLQAMGCDEAVVTGAIRVSFGRQNRLEEVIWAADRILLSVRELKRKCLFQDRP